MPRESALVRILRIDSRAEDYVRGGLIGAGQGSTELRTDLAFVSGEEEMGIQVPKHIRSSSAATFSKGRN